MEDVNVFEGDVLYTATPDGGDIKIENGLVKDCRNFDTATYLSLFGGNENDTDGTVVTLMLMSPMVITSPVLTLCLLPQKFE